MTSKFSRQISFTIETKKLLVRNISNKADILLLVILSAILYRSLLLPGIHMAGDWPCFSEEYLCDYLSWPSAWPSTGLLSMYEGAYSLYRFPIRFIQALIMKLFSSEYVAMLIMYFIPIVVLPPIGIYLLVHNLFQDRSAAFFSGLAFIFNNILPWRVSLGQPTLAVVLALMPIALNFYINSLHRNSYSAATLCAIILSISILYDLRTTYLSLLLLGTYGVYYVIKYEIKSTLKIIRLLKMTILISIVIGITQAYQILPIVAMGNANPLPTSYVVPNALKMLSLSDFSQILIMTHYGWGLDEGPLLPKIIITLLAFSALLFSRDPRILYFTLIYILFALLAKGSVEPLGFLNDWLFIHAPFFNWFREPLVFQMPQLIPFTVLFGISASKLGRIVQKPKALSRKIVSILVAFSLITLLIWSIWPVFSISGAYADPSISYIAANSIPESYHLVSRWLKSQSPGRVLMLPLYSSYIYTHSSYQGVTLNQMSIPFWGDYVKQSIVNNKTSGIAKLLSLYDVKYVIINPPEDIYWRFHPHPSYSYYYSVLKNTGDLEFVNNSNTKAKIFISKFTLSRIRPVYKIGLLIGNMPDMVRLIDLVNPQEWAFVFAEQLSPATKDLDVYSAIIFSEDRSVEEIILEMVNEPYRIPLWSYASYWGSDDPGKWVIGYPITSRLAQDITISPKGLLANAFPEQNAQMDFQFYVPETDIYEIWIRSAASSPMDSITIAVGSETLKIPPSNLSTSLRWIKVGSVKLQKETIKVSIMGQGQVFIDVMAIVPKYVLSEIRNQVLAKIEPKCFTLNEFINRFSSNNNQTCSSYIQWIRKRTNSINLKFVTNRNGNVTGDRTHRFLVFSEPYDTFWKFSSKSYETRSIPAYGFVNMFIIDPDVQEGEIVYSPQNFLDLGVWISMLGSSLILLLLLIATLKSRQRDPVLFETRNISYRYFCKHDIPRLVELISSSPEAMPLFFHSIDVKTGLKIFMLRFTYEKYIDRLKKFAISLSPSVLFTSAYDRTVIVAVDKEKGKVIGAVFLSPILDSWSLDIIVVDKAYRRRGIGSTLLELAKKHVKSLGASILITSTLSNSAQAEFFRKRGFATRNILNEMQCKL